MTARQLADLIDGHTAALTLFARSWCAAPDDVVQIAFCKLAALRTWPDDPVAWLYRVVRNAAIDAAKAERRRSRREAAVARDERWFHEREFDGLDAEVAVIALQSLPDDQREIIIARLWGELTFEQIATVAACSVSSAFRRYEAGIATLRERLGAECPTKMQ